MKVWTVLFLVMLAFSRRWAEDLNNNCEDYLTDEVMNKIDNLESEIQKISNETQIDSININSNSHNTVEDIIKVFEELYETPRILNTYRTELLRIQPELCLPFEKLTGPLEIHIQNESFEVNCDGDTAGTGWTIIQRRQGESTDFQKSLLEYKRGFGHVNGSYFIGLRRLHALTARTPHELYIHLESPLGEIRYAKYSHFRIGNEADKYKLNKLNAYCGNAGDSLSKAMYKNFGIYETAENTSTNEQQSSLYTGWWIAQWTSEPCKSNLNAVRSQWTTWNQTLNRVQMMIRPQKNLPNWCMEKSSYKLL